MFKADIPYMGVCVCVCVHVFEGTRTNSAWFTGKRKEAQFGCYHKFLRVVPIDRFSKLLVQGWFPFKHGFSKLLPKMGSLQTHNAERGHPDSTPFCPGSHAQPTKSHMFPRPRTWENRVVSLPFGQAGSPNVLPKPTVDYKQHCGWLVGSKLMVPFWVSTTHFSLF